HYVRSQLGRYFVGSIQVKGIFLLLTAALYAFIIITGIGKTEVALIICAVDRYVGNRAVAGLVKLLHVIRMCLILLERTIIIIHFPAIVFRAKSRPCPVYGA